MPKNNRSGQSKILTDQEFSKLRCHLKNDRDRLLFDILRFTGERAGAVLQLRRWDCYTPRGEVRSEITFRRSTRKATANGKRYTRQLSVHPTLWESLASYPYEEGNLYLFPGRGAEEETHLTIQGLDYLLRRAAERAGIGGRGISSHSFRRTMITRLDERGVSPKVIQAITGHRSLNSVQRYIEVSEKRVQAALSLL